MDTLKENWFVIVVVVAVLFILGIMASNKDDMIKQWNYQKKRRFDRKTGRWTANNSMKTMQSAP